MSKKSNTAAKRFFHYTVSRGFIKGILGSGTIHLEPKYYAGQVCAAWFSSNPVWEHTVNKTGDKTSGADVHAKLFGAFRVEIDPAKVELHSWVDFKKNSGESNRICNGLVKVGERMGANPYDWFCTYSEIPVNADTVKSVGVYHNGHWEDYSLEDFVNNKIAEKYSVEFVSPGHRDYKDLKNRAAEFSAHPKKSSLKARLEAIVESGKSENIEFTPENMSELLMYL